MDEPERRRQDPGVVLKTHRVHKDGKQPVYYSLCGSPQVGRKRVWHRQMPRLSGLAERYPQAWRYVEISVESLSLRWKWGISPGCRRPISFCQPSLTLRLAQQLSRVTARSA